MNEKQRLEQTAQIETASHPADRKSALDRLKEKTTKDYEKYFTKVFLPPNLKEAKKRGKEEIQYVKDFAIPDEFRGMGRGRKFYIRTYGCQMNEHDTEVMAGIFMALGYEPTDRPEEANVILLNTCAIRENAENKVFGELGYLKPLKTLIKF